MRMVKHSRFLHYVQFLIFKIDHNVSEAESVPILKNNEIFLLQCGAINNVQRVGNHIERKLFCNILLTGSKYAFKTRLYRLWMQHVSAGRYNYGPFV